MDKKVIRKKVRECVEIMVLNTLSQMQSQEFADVVCSGLFDEKIDAGIDFNYVQEKERLSSKHSERFVDDITNQIMQRFKEVENWV